MKKPNITEGEWELLEEGTIENGELYLVNSEEGLAVHDSFHRANARAISAVPEMIEALIKAKQAIVQYIECADDDLLMEVDEQIEQALEKAGVEL